ncbi:MAG: YkvA family protein [Thermomonas sp.]
MRAAPPADIPLPWDDRPDHPNRNRVAGFRLDPSAVSRFDQLLHEVHPEARHVDVDRIASIGRWLHELPADQARAVLDERLARIEHLRAMLDDRDWDQREVPCKRVRTLLAYLDQDADLIPDAIPVLGLLDDVILLELAWPAVATEAEDYRDFCNYRDSEQPVGDGAKRREAWITDRLRALALLQQHNRVHDSHYGLGRPPEQGFRIS